ncbi:hypothetical protein [Corynebacterium renale]|uniref:Secreted protein n=1 Tax=Corynebacterium renale TaxID=1724 RepID=A0A2A9DM01_9CORY|nr:hypothetical protein [Corynebacterium renale]PFG27614.1 hypothetical protein ATK06_0686 [Corynebacterium renale]SQI22806.1 Uncharacterised protein [Corynebacterium renale]
MRKLIAGASATAMACALAACTTPTEPAAPSTTTVTALTTVTAMPGPCTPELITNDGYQYEEFVMFCDGTWKYAGQPASDHTWFARWDGTSWVPYAKDGAHSMSALPCYNPETLRNEGLPEAIIQKYQNIGPICADSPNA